MADMTEMRMTAREFSELPETNLPTELIDGELIMSPAPDDPHQKFALYTVAFLVKLNLDGELRFSPIDVYLDDENVVQPDVMWVSKDNPNCQLVDGRRWHGAPDLVVEIFSPSTARRDKTVKFDLYEKHRVREYWMIDPEAEYLEVWTLKDGRFTRIGVFGPEETFDSPVLSGMAVEVGALFGKA